MKIAIVTPIMKSGEKGGAEALYEGMVHNLRTAGYQTDQVQVVTDESSFDAILDSYQRCAELNLDDYDIVVSTKAPTYMVRHRNHVSYLLHTIRVFYDMFHFEFGAGTADHRKQRMVIHALDKQGLHPDQVRGHFANGATTFKRLFDSDPFWKQIPFKALHHPPFLEGYREPRRGEFIFLPSRLHRWKRVDLVIKAFRHLKHDIQLKISGTGEDERALRDLARGDTRIEFLGRITDEQLLDLYSGALVVPFVPRQEDYGLITIEAFKSKKPVITCTDSGETLHFVKDFETGFVVEPRPEAIAEKLAYLIDHSDKAAEMGRNGCAATSSITWDSVIAGMLEPVLGSRNSGKTVFMNGTPNNGHALTHESKKMLKVTVLDMQPIDPPIGGGRIRLLGLYHNLGADVRATYVGTYDWPGEKYRRHRLSESLEEIDIPLTPEHFAVHEQWRQRAGGNSLIDVSFDLLAHHSPEYVSAARAQTKDAEVVVFSHPWIYLLVKNDLDGKVVVYDSQNVEGYLRAVLLDNGGFGSEMAKHVAALEYELCHRADLVLACSNEDRQLFNELYEVPFEKVLIVPNGTFTSKIHPPDATEKEQARRQLHLSSGPLAIFLGSAYQPNVEAAEYICRVLAPSLPDVTFAVCGGVGSALKAHDSVRNVRVTGQLSESDKLAYLSAAGLAINPMFSGSGTNIKMFDFMAAGLPIVSTVIGARGISQGSETVFSVCDKALFAQEIRRILDDQAHGDQLGKAARRRVQEAFSWERISANLGRRLQRARAKFEDRAPFFSVIVATYERHDYLPALLECLRKQECRDFEVIIIDQSKQPWAAQSDFADLDICYLHTDVKGAVKARNAGSFHARGRVLAFTDDDTQPYPDWLAKAVKYFDAPGVVGVEGLVLSDKVGDPDYRPVTNQGFEGIGFMTANLLIRRDIFLALDGFDERFDNPHFREDTDFGWRAQEQGQIPFGHDVRVFHPPHRRDIVRESLAERNRFFEKDALLLEKHPGRYRTLFLREGHYRHTKGFWENFLRGTEKYRIQLEAFYQDLAPTEPCAK